MVVIFVVFVVFMVFLHLESFSKENSRVPSVQCSNTGGRNDIHACVEVPLERIGVVSQTSDAF